jgi:hypothetical protein
MLSLIDKISENEWSVSSGKPLKRHPIFGGHFAAESGGQFERILQIIPKN